MYAPGEVIEVTQHDGSVLRLRKLAEGYDPGDRLAAMNHIAAHEARGEIVTGLLYVDGAGRGPARPPEDGRRRRSTGSASASSARARRRSPRSTPSWSDLSARFAGALVAVRGLPSRDERSFYSWRMTHALAQVAWEDCLLEPRRDRALEAFARETQGVPNPTIAYFASVPWLARALVELHPEYGLLQRLDPDVADLVSLIVSQENSCRFCYSAVRRDALGAGHEQGPDRPHRAGPRGGRPAAAHARRHRLRPAQSRSGPPARSGACAALRAAGVTNRRAEGGRLRRRGHRLQQPRHTIPAIPTAAARAHARAVAYAPAAAAGRPDAAQPPPPWRAAPLEHAPDSRTRDLVRRLCRLADRAGAGAHARGDVGVAAPDAALQAADARGHRARPVVRRLRRRARVRRSQPRACEGAALERILTHLDGPELDATERLLVPFARETIWYEPAAHPAPRARAARAASRAAAARGDRRRRARQRPVPDGRDPRVRALTAGLGRRRSCSSSPARGRARSPSAARTRACARSSRRAPRELEHLQQACSRLAPDGVVQRLIDADARRRRDPTARAQGRDRPVRRPGRLHRAQRAARAGRARARPQRLPTSA